MSVDLSIIPSKTAHQLVNFIKKTLNSSGFSKLVIGLSGGVDSATSIALAVKAIGAANIYPGVFPYGEMNEEGVVDTGLILEKFQIPLKNITKIDIKSLVDPVIVVSSRPGLEREQTKGPALIDLRRGNIMARMRMILLYDLSKKCNALVLGTENKTEYLLGYFTRFGDEASDIEPIINLYKSQVKELATYLGVPWEIIEKPPTAGLWQGQTDEGEFGFTYEEAEQILYLWHDKKYTKEAIIKNGFNKDIVEKVIKRVADNNFKHNLPYTLK